MGCTRQDLWGWRLSGPGSEEVRTSVGGGIGMEAHDVGV